MDLLARLVSRAKGRIVVMAGGAIRAEHVQRIISATRVPAIHVGSGACRGFKGEVDVGQVSAIVSEAKKRETAQSG